MFYIYKYCCQTPTKCSVLLLFRSYDQLPQTEILTSNCSHTSARIRNIKNFFLWLSASYPKVEQKVLGLISDFSLYNWKYLRGKMHIEISRVKTQFLGMLYLNLICVILCEFTIVTISASIKGYRVESLAHFRKNILFNSRGLLSRLLNLLCSKVLISKLGMKQYVSDRVMCRLNELTYNSTWHIVSPQMLSYCDYF